MVDTDNIELKQKIYHEYKIEERDGSWFTAWYNDEGDMQWESVSPSEKLAKSAAEFLYNTYSKKAQAEKTTATDATPVNPELLRAAFQMNKQYTTFVTKEIDGIWHIQWYNEKGMPSRLSAITFPSREEAYRAARAIRENIDRKMTTSIKNNVSEVKESAHRDDLSRLRSSPTPPKYTTYVITRDNSKYWIEWLNDEGKVVSSHLNGYNTWYEASEEAKYLLALRNGDKNAKPPEHKHVYNTPYVAPKVLSFDEKWLDGISKFFTDGVPEDIKNILKTGA